MPQSDVENQGSSKMDNINRFVIELKLSHRLGARHIHKFLMKCLNPLDRSEMSPRADAGLLWRQDFQVLTVQTVGSNTLDVPVNFGILKPAVLPEPTGELRVKVARQYRPNIKIDPVTAKILREQGKDPKKTKMRLTPVPEERLEDWAVRLLERRGLEIKSIKCSIVEDVVLDTRDKRQRIPAAEIVANVNGDTWPIVVNGLGRGKNYGFGLVQTGS